MLKKRREKLGARKEWLNETLVELLAGAWTSFFFRVGGVAFRCHPLFFFSLRCSRYIYWCSCFFVVACTTYGQKRGGWS